MNDGGSIRIDGGNTVFTAAGNKILNNKIHDVTDASIMDSNGYGGNGIYLDNQTGLVDVENNLVYRVSGYDVYTPQGPAAPKNANTIKNNILAFGRHGDGGGQLSLSGNGVPSSAVAGICRQPTICSISTGTTASSPKFWVQGGCVYCRRSSVHAVSGMEQQSVLAHRRRLRQRCQGIRGAAQRRHRSGMRRAAATPTNGPSILLRDGSKRSARTRKAWCRIPGSTTRRIPRTITPAKGSPGAGFVVFDPSQAGRSNPVLMPPAIPATFPTKLFNPATDY